MTDTICVLALDAADYQLLREWECDNLLLEKHHEIETFSWSREHPYTPEVWASVATGVSPEQHGIGEAKQELEWDNPILRLGSKFTQYLPEKTRQDLGRPLRELGVDDTFQTVDESLSTPFDHTLSWPGLGPAEHLREMWALADDANYGDVSTEKIESTFQSLTGQELGYLASMSESDNAVVGVHAHILDIAGHMYAERPTELQRWYEWVNKEVGRLREQCDTLVILSDHGMQTSYLNDDDPGSHSWRPYIASQGIDDALPESVYKVKDYLTRNRPDIIRPEDDARMDTPTETLEDLGYL